jgi:hypothetical protein
MGTRGGRANGAPRGEGLVPGPRPPSRAWYALAAVIVAVGLVVGIALALDSYRDTQDRIDGFDRARIPGSTSVRVDEPGGRVVYFEGDQRIGLADLILGVTGPDDADVPLEPYDGELVYDTSGDVQGRALATFDARAAGVYEVEASGVETGRVAVGESVSRRVLTGVFGGLVIAGSSFVAGVALGVVTLVRRSRRRVDDRLLG